MVHEVIKAGVLSSMMAEWIDLLTMQFEKVLIMIVTASMDKLFFL